MCNVHYHNPLSSRNIQQKTFSSSWEWISFSQLFRITPKLIPLRARAFEGSWAPRDPHVLSWVWKRTLITEFESRFSFIELTFGRMPTLTKRSRTSTFQEVFTQRSIEFLRLASASGIPFSRHTSTSCHWWLRGWSGFRCRFWCTIVTLMPETT